LEIAPGEVVALLGPNGAGKTTVLRLLAGLLALDDGRIALGAEEKVVFDDPSADIFVPPERRPIGMVFQDYLLFGHLDALDNVAFGLRARGMGKIDARRLARDWLERVGLSDHAGHRPDALSGGQAQRVALARALATEPHLLLLDEPLAALDAGTRAEVRRDLRRHLAGFDGIRLLVTHDPIDAYVLADRVVILEEGRITQAGTLGEVTAHPGSRYAADLVGINFLTGRLDGTVLTTPDGVTVVTHADLPPGAAHAAIAPAAVALHRQRPDGSARNTWACRVAGIDHRANRVHVTLDGPPHLVAEITPAALAALGIRPGDEVWAAVKATEVTAYPA
ncbi:MAG: ABC transporter ATP-binding protein, partial [Acidobacteria bacterium]|nr:ABC transporter ATP-binding protein [Acidobacteriota bacterium]